MTHEAPGSRAERPLPYLNWCGCYLLNKRPGGGWRMISGAMTNGAGRMVGRTQNYGGKSGKMLYRWGDCKRYFSLETGTLMPVRLYCRLDALVRSSVALTSLRRPFSMRGLRSGPHGSGFKAAGRRSSANALLCRSTVQ